MNNDRSLIWTFFGTPSSLFSISLSSVNSLYVDLDYTLENLKFNVAENLGNFLKVRTVKIEFKVAASHQEFLHIIFGPLFLFTNRNIPQRL